ncbi:MAG: rod shape-determining protein MreD [Prevotella sp.]|jgi:rod shape-determining protein MreD|nr:rod shape-determining protein MreD [Prevotella sp.]MBP3842411.1 rod shape-determining protein MreD [Prevotella sp.]
MTIDSLKRLLVFVLFCLAQALVCNRIQLFHCAIPLPYIHFVIMFPRNLPKWSILLWSFALGVTIDMFSNTPGVASSSLTLAGALQPYLLEFFIPRDAEENINVSAKTLGWGKFSTFTLLIVFIFCFTFFTVEAFNFYNWQQWLQYIFSSMLLTFILILSLETIRQ